MVQMAANEMLSFTGCEGKHDWAIDVVHAEAHDEQQQACFQYRSHGMGGGACLATFPLCDTVFVCDPSPPRHC